jgi:hypothetical protein
MTAAQRRKRGLTSRALNELLAYVIKKTLCLWVFLAAPEDGHECNRANQE